MSKIRNKEYMDELAELKTRMIKAETFAEKIPLFADEILKGKLSGEEMWVRITDRYKDIYFAWGLNRGHFKRGVSGDITNHPTKDYDGYFFSVYINTLTLYDLHESFSLYDAFEGVEIFFIDHLNSRFYIEDEHIELFLEALNAWYLKARVSAKKLNAKKKLEKAQADLDKARQELEK